MCLRPLLQVALQSEAVKVSQALLAVRTSNFQQTTLLQMLRELRCLWGVSKLPYGVILGFVLQSQCQFVKHEHVDAAGRTASYVLPVPTEGANIFEQLVKKGSRSSCSRFLCVGRQNCFFSGVHSSLRIGALLAPAGLRGLEGMTSLCKEMRVWKEAEVQLAHIPFQTKVQTQREKNLAVLQRWHDIDLPNFAGVEGSLPFVRDSSIVDKLVMTARTQLPPREFTFFPFAPAGAVLSPQHPLKRALVQRRLPSCTCFLEHSSCTCFLEHSN